MDNQRGSDRLYPGGIKLALQNAFLFFANPERICFLPWDFVSPVVEKPACTGNVTCMQWNIAPVPVDVMVSVLPLRYGVLGY